MFTMLLPLADLVVFVWIEDSAMAVLYSGLPDLSYCSGDHIFHPLSSTAWNN